MSKIVSMDVGSRLKGDISNQRVWSFSQTTVKPEDSLEDFIIADVFSFPAGAKGVVMWLRPGEEGGTGKVQFSLSPYRDLVSGGGYWEDWPHGNVSRVTVDGMHQVTAVRALCYSGTVIFEGRSST